MSEEFQLKLRGRTAVFVDWANVYRWKDKLKKAMDAEKLYKYLKSYDQVGEVRFYFGEDDVHPKSREFLETVRKMGYFLATKKVKYLKIYDDTGGNFIWKRKCDFDLEIGLDAIELMKDYDSFVFFSGDGDYATLYERLIRKGKQVVVVYMYGCLGREIWEMKRGIFKASVVKLGVDLFQKMTPDRRSRARLG